MTYARRQAGARTLASPTSAGPRRPDARTGRARARLLLLPALALLLGALGLGHAKPASAAVLVSNIGQTAVSTVNFSGQFTSLGFTTGSHALGYTLSSIEMKMLVTGTLSSANRATIRAELWSDSSGTPNAKLADLTVPSSVTTGNVTFTAPTDTRLKASTTYHVVVYTTGSLTTLRWRSSTSDSEDTGGAAGWSIADSQRYQNTNSPGTGTWTSNARVPLIRVNGAARQASTVATLSGLTASTSTSATGTFTAQTLTPSTFAATTTSYTVSVANSVTHAKLTPTVTDSGATVKVGVGTSLTAVSSASASGAIALSVGANAIKAVVTAEDGTTTQTYTVTVTRRQPPTMEFELDTLLVVESDTDPETPKVLLSEALAVQTTVGIRVRSYGNASPADFTLSMTTVTFAPGDTEKTFPVLAAADMLTEGNEVFTLELVAVASAPYTLGSNDHIELVIVDDSFEPGLPGLTSLTAVESGANKPTATTLSFTVACATADSGFPLTDYHVHAVAQGVAGLERTYYFPESKCGTNGPVTLTGLPLRPTATTWRVRARARAIRGQRGSWSPSVELATLADPAQQNAAALTASFAGVPSAHTGNDHRFTFTVNFNVSVDGGQVPTRRSFETSHGAVMQVVRVSGKKWTVHVRPTSWRKVGIALRGGRSCDDPHAVCATGGRALTNSPQASVGGAARIRVTSHWTKEAKQGTSKPVRFIVKLSRAVSHEVRVDYATKDGEGMLGGNGPAAAGADYTATSGTLVFTAGERRKTVNVAVLNDSIDEGAEYFLLVLSNPRGAHLPWRQVEKVGLIRNSDPLQQAWLARFGRTVASDAVGALTARLETPRDAGSHLTLAGQRVSLGRTDDDGTALAETLTGLARAFGAEEEGANDDPFARHGLAVPWNDSATAPGRAMTGRELLLGSSFRAVLGGGAGSQWTSWGQGASVSRFSAAVPGLDLNGESATGSMGMDYERGRLLAGFAMTHSVGEGTAEDEGWRYALGSTATMAMPYARLALSERLSAWGLAGTGAGTLTLDLDGAVAQHYRTDLSMTLAAAGVRGDLLTPTEADGFALALKADAFWVRTESDRVAATEFGSLAGARGESSRVRAVLDGSRTFSFARGASLTPSVELGLRHDGGDAETGTGVELGAGLGYADPSRGLDMALKVHGLAVHAQDGYDEWGVSGQLRLVPGGRGRGLSASLTPSWGVDPSGSERLWALPDAHALAANDEAANPSSRLDTELGYSLSVFGGGFTGTPNVGLGLSGDGARDWRVGWRLTPAASGDTGFEVSLDATRREAANADAPEHGVMLRSLVRW